MRFTQKSYFVNFYFKLPDFDEFLSLIVGESVNSMEKFLKYSIIYSQLPHAMDLLEVTRGRVIHLEEMMNSVVRQRQWGRVNSIYREVKMERLNLYEHEDFKQFLALSYIHTIES
jgi:hypothetical protein